MIGMIITGHGNFATGMKSALTLLAGEPKEAAFIDFDEACTPQRLEEKVSQAMDQLLQKNEGVIVLCDLLGGTPFKVSALCARKKEKVDVVAGMNLGMLSEVNLTREYIDSVYDLAQNAQNVGKDCILHFVSQVK